MARIRDRAFAGFGAALFLVTSSALTIAVIFSLTQNNSSNSSQNQSTNQSTSSNSATTKLQGTKLAGFTPVSNVTSLKITDLTKGNGPVVKPNSTITVDYTGAVAATGIIFQSSKDSGQPVTLSLSKVILGWQQGIPGMKVGGTRQLLIPANLAYGANPPAGSGIPPNSPLVFNVTVYKID